MRRGGTDTSDAGEADSTLARLEDAFASIVREMLRELRNNMSGLSPAQMMALKEISSGRSVTARAIAQKIGITEAGVSQIISGLRRSDFVTRTRDPHDRRKLELVLTPQGNHILDVNKKRRRETLREVLSVLSADELEQLARLLQKIGERADERTPAADATCGHDG